MSSRRCRFGNCTVALGLLTAWMGSAGVSCSKEPDANRDPARQGRSGDLAAECESRIEDLDPIPILAADLAFHVAGRIGDESRDPVGGVAGAAWDSRQERLYVLDHVAGEVRVLDRSGTLLDRFGRYGQGPGEFEELNSFIDNPIALAGRYVIVSDLTLLHGFEGDGRFVHRIRADEESTLGTSHVAALSDSTVLFARTGEYDMKSPDPEVRTRLALVELAVRGGKIEIRPIGVLRNPLVHAADLDELRRSRGPFRPRDPYGRLYRRTWDAVSTGLIAAVSFRHHGICFFDRQGRLTSAFRVDAPVIKVDAAERRRVLDEMREQFGPRAPFIGTPWEDFYPDWPEAAPTYVDIVLAPDGTAWVERPTPGWGRAIDLFHPTRGYIGSIEPLGEGLPVTFEDDCALFVATEVSDSGDAGEGFHGLVRWCLGSAKSS
jgi:hypothetical protein